VTALAARHRYLGDLALTFPGLLFALAASPGTQRDAIALALCGAPLKHIAAAAGVPLWLRALPPEAFDTPLPELPDSEAFRLRIANLRPRDRRLAPLWLRAVGDAAALCDDAFALFVAREFVRPPRPRRGRRRTGGQLRLLSLYAWYSRAPGTAAHRLIERPWSEDMSLANAQENANAWWTCLDLFTSLGEKPIDPWLKPGVVDGYAFVPLCTWAEIADEARAMETCLRDYGYDVQQDCLRFWSVRRDGQRVATLSIGMRRDGGFLDITELQARGNTVAPREVWRAARQWFGQADGRAVEPRAYESVLPDRRAWIELWRPYWLAKRTVPDWLPLSPARHSLCAIA
jgi:hypothetical protein